MYDSEEDPFNLFDLWRRFNSASLSVNADLSYAVHINNNSIQSTKYIIYNVYNNGHQIGGQLNVTVDYSIECNDRECTNLSFISDLYQRTVYGNRNNLYDINFRVATLVSSIRIIRLVILSIYLCLGFRHQYREHFARGHSKVSVVRN